MGTKPVGATVKRVVLAVTTVGAFLTPWMVSSINIALPTIGRQYSMSAVAMGWVSTIYILASAALLVPFSKLGDIFGRRRIYVVGAVVFCIASLLCAWTPNEHWLMVFRALQGAGAALIFGTGVAIVSSVFPPGERGRALGINVAATYLGLSAGPVLGGFMTQRLGWHSVFVAAAILAALVAALMAVFVKQEWKVDGGRRRFDFVGSAIYVIALTGFTWVCRTCPRCWALRCWRGNTDACTLRVVGIEMCRSFCSTCGCSATIVSLLCPIWLPSSTTALHSPSASLSASTSNT